ncbi:MAG: hypothetical protein ABI612_15775 [Betaproteobacteria bacterium]
MIWINEFPERVRVLGETRPQVVWPDGATDYDIPTFIRRGIHIPKLEMVSAEKGAAPVAIERRAEAGASSAETAGRHCRASGDR